MGAAAWVRAEGLAVGRGGRRLLAGLDFACLPGDALVLIGPNGSGKSSLLRLLAGLAAPTAGRLVWQEGYVADDIAAYRASLHFIGHQDGLKPALGVAETLRFWMALAGENPKDDRAVAQALSALGLSGLAASPCRLLSAGQRRRLALARLVTSPRPLWLLDEPGVGLDTQALAALAWLLAQHREAGGMVILSTHQPLDLGDTSLLALDEFRPVRGVSGAADAGLDLWDGV